ncbi:MAG: bifunctional diaminohydroxyphosphoribosylaminopyrimidine deaminase/5-amino-6-(5-phosphoribosylamino)uracil reductase RibD [Eubacteriales bacterium]|nr:bifunctional diaminohydroxyphosphoribosylaminopyrimidine deaminase/5-amino-6-(5-phosphoribosylamino)uracil reductase RibD [Eubacteriales bacterium]MDD3349241.1 bifunctional diaminohydroxyphosphoribosylaminopyrimidine deaminase/5-amino-6-(5-phosphoribosylamino)uracil reductase RibD [Eubacteriales bacterium]
MTDELFMREALLEAEKGRGLVNPNPMVGALIVKDKRIIGRGHHERYGGLHAERNALASCTESPKGATMYVTLEPCCHFGKTPPCTDAIIESELASVVAASLDPNHLVAGKGLQILKEHGIDTKVGVLEKECRRLNEVFFHYITTGKPFVIMKYAMTLDGKIATASGKSKWITGELAREHGHRSRNNYRAIMVGAGTVLEDDPLLTCRIENGRNPIRIICDTRLRIPLDSKIVESAKTVETIVATASADQEAIRRLEEKGIEILSLPERKGHIDLCELMRVLGERKIDSILLEGGAILHAAALESGIVNKVQAYIAPKIFGGILAKSPVAGTGIDDPEEAYHLVNRELTMLGDDILLEYYLESEVKGCLQES